MQFGNDPISWLFAPESSEIFLKEYFNKKHFICHNEDRRRFAELLSFQELDEILGAYGLKFPEIRLAQLDKDVPPVEYTTGKDRIDPLKVARLFSAGATVIYRALQHRHQNVQLLCDALAQQSTIQTQANIYLTPPNSQGFNVHWDTHDVFVIQVEGSKDWRIYEGGIPIPIKTQKFNSSKFKHGDVIDEFTLHAGEVLYIPRGIMHAAQSTDQISLHITLGFLGYSWAELLIDALAEHLDQYPSMRENLPYGYANTEKGDFSRMKKMLREHVEELVDQIDLNPLLEAHIWKVRESSRPREANYLSNALQASGLSDNQKVEKLSGMTVTLEDRDDRIFVSGGARELSFPQVARRTLETVFQGQPVSIEDLDSEIDITSRKTVVSKLIKEGLLKQS